MNLERLLAENMIRFGTRNLSEHQIKKILKEALGTPAAVKNTNPTIESFITDSKNWGPLFTKNVETIKSLLSKNGVTFSSTTVDTAAAWIAFSSKAVRVYSDKNPLRKSLKDVNKLKESIEAISGDSNSITEWGLETIIQLNESPNDPGKVLTVGVVSKTGVTGQDAGQSSNMADILTYCNDFNIGMIATDDYEGKIGSYITQIEIDPYKVVKGEIDSQGSFIEGNPRTTPGAGSLDLINSESTLSTSCVLYADQQYKAASAQSTGTQTNEILWTPGPETTAELPKNLFPTLKITMAADMAPLVTKAIEDAKKLGQIIAMRIESGASYDRPVELDQAGFAKALGLSIDQVPSDPKVDAEGVVTDPMSGGNAFLSYQRGQALLKAIGNTAGVTPTMLAKVETGGDAAQYAKLIFSIKKPDQTTTITKDDLKTIGVKSTTSELGGQFKIIKLEAF